MHLFYEPINFICICDYLYVLTYAYNTWKNVYQTLTVAVFGERVETFSVSTDLIVL